MFKKGDVRLFEHVNTILLPRPGSDKHIGEAQNKTRLILTGLPRRAHLGARRDGDPEERRAQAEQPRQRDRFPQGPVQHPHHDTARGLQP